MEQYKRVPETELPKHGFERLLLWILFHDVGLEPPKVIWYSTVLCSLAKNTHTQFGWDIITSDLFFMMHIDRDWEMGNGVVNWDWELGIG